ncbi:MAG TPA: FAD-dependent monooxygenase [Beijerinckia sp.]|jgi:2-octaprenyl-6-methoxyphenol hydroxylase|nr:FAD-dependent monooxygenase [Beijerinckia sp.]
MGFAVSTGSADTPFADILVAGAGAAGLSAAICLAQAGFSVICVGQIDTRANGRTVALFEGSLRFYRALGLWTRFASKSSALEKIRMIDDTGSRFPIPSITFAASEIGFSAFGENIENNVLVEGLAEIARETANLRLYETMLRDLVFEPDWVRATTQEGHSIEARLVVAADGRASLARTKAGIGVRGWTYPQVALTALLAHEKPHHQVSTEFHTRAGPCTLVPLRGLGSNPHRSSLVWLMSRREAERRRALGDAALEIEIERQVHSLLGPMSIDGERGFFPMTGMRVSRLVGHRIALIGEAAHVFPPLAAQGLNLSLRDSASLVECLEYARAKGWDPGSRAALEPYEKRHGSDISLRTSGIDVLNRSLLSDFFPIDLIRGAGLLAFSAIGPLRRAIMREGILPHGYTPRLMRSRPVQNGIARN